MKCARCGAELREGNLYCSVCGREAQIVNGYSVIEEDYLKALLAQEEKEQSFAPPQHRLTEEKRKQAEEEKRTRKKAFWKVCAATVAVAAVVFTAAALFITYKNHNSYDYQVQMARKQTVDRNYERALSYYKNALALEPNDIAARIEMAEIYMKENEYDAALVSYTEVVMLDKKNKKAYQGLISIYEQRREYQKIKELSEQVQGTELLNLFEVYLAQEPEFLPKEGTYDIETEITLSAQEQCDIFYTIDGTDPKQYGTLYTDAILFDEAGTYTIKAVSCNEKGIYSEVANADYQITATRPSYPKVVPDGGVMEETTFVVIAAQKECDIYYTWDGTNPTTKSARYTTPIQVPEGNHILSILVVNPKTKLSSQIYRTNFIYEPENTTVENEL